MRFTWGEKESCRSSHTHTRARPSPLPNLLCKKRIIHYPFLFLSWGGARGTELNLVVEGPRVHVMNPVPQSGAELCGELHDTYWPQRGGGGGGGGGGGLEYVTIGAPQTLTGESAPRGLQACRAMLLFGRGVAAAGGI